ncbi:Mbeg1-like protein [Lacticaseibacillus nasuensis]|uniref:Mbeg1-like protein n=1 Tax=Lacticaseibacillus nasuensis TaxID=944671 RepID=UPI00224790B6|nr:Mbeg1-like protein [Lacticaseibacillus nasuensis]MCX2456337.1 DUF2974 domain-containing protein [Lacticaseibacillus nasuensis]
MATRNLISFITQHGNQSFIERPFTVVDAVICAQLAYCDFAQAAGASTFGELTTATTSEAMVAGTWAQADNERLLAALANSRRYQNVAWLAPVNRRNLVAEQQFSAVTFALTPTQHYVAFRGTRASFVDWKEDFNLTYTRVIPSQRAAAVYLDEMHRRYPGQLFVGGHSKGGNLAAFALGHSLPATQAAIAMAYNFDGPGLQEPLPNALQGKLLKLVPENSLIGIILDPAQDFGVVKSTGSGFRQHDPFTWVVNGTNFTYLAATDRRTQYAQRTLAAWLAGLDDTTKALALNQLYAVIQATDAQTFTELQQRWPQHAKTILAGLTHADPAAKAAWRAVAAQLWLALTADIHPPAPLAAWRAHHDHEKSGL